MSCRPCVCVPFHSVARRGVWRASPDETHLVRRVDHAALDALVHHLGHLLIC